MKLYKLSLLVAVVASLNLCTVSIHADYYEETDGTYVPVVTPVVEGTGEVVYGAGRVAKGAVVGTGEVLTGDPVGGVETIATETVGGTADAVRGALATPGNILFGR